MPNRKASRSRPAGRRGAWLGGTAILVLLLAPVVVVALTHHHPTAAELWAAFLVVGVPLASLFLAIASWLNGRRGDSSTDIPTLPDIADQLAVSVRDQWTEEADARRLNEPYPLPVFWIPGDPSLAADWNELKELATSGAGWPTPSEGEAWASGPAYLAGGGNQLVDILARVPTGRMLVLGERGAGKTLLMVRLVLDLLARRTRGGQVPVLTSLASWDPRSQELDEWLANQLVIDHPGLAAITPVGEVERTRAHALIKAGLIFPILDGLDEISDAVLAFAIKRINEALRHGGKVVVTCRTEKYREAVISPGGVATRLQAAAIELCPLNPEDVKAYLRKDAGSTAEQARWDPVLAAVGTQEPVGRALTTPLMVGLARAIYNPRPDESTEQLPEPKELCTFANEAEVRDRLFDGFVPAAYRRRLGRRKLAKAERSLIFLARHLEHTIGNPNLAWWQLHRAMRPVAVKLVFGLLFGLVFGLLVGLVLGGGGLAGIFIGSVLALLAGFRFRQPVNPAQGVRFRIRPVRKLGLKLLIGAGVPGLAPGLALAFWLDSAPGDLAAVTSPRAVLARDRRTAFFLLAVVPWLIALLAGLFVWLLVGVMVVLVKVPQPNPAPPFHLSGLPIITLAIMFFAVAGPGLGFGLWFCLVKTAWPSYLLVRVWLALTRRMPWRLIPFLVDGHKRGILRQVGAVYQFRHAELQSRLANQPRAGWLNEARRFVGLFSKRW